MFTAAIIAIPLFMIVAGTVAALSFAANPEAEALQASDSATTQQARFSHGSLDMTAAPLMLGEAATTTTGEPVPVEQLLQEIELHLKKERQAAAAFAKNPSSRALWVN